ncbi:MAG: peptide deformylase [Clostridia bacterium]|nr:peptide deformylase [Clostridia bacterium]
MAIRNIRMEGDPILSKVSKEVEEVDDKIKQLVEDMFDTMHKADGLGLAAVQVGILKRVVVIDLYDGTSKFVLINPVITKLEGEKVEFDEGCLSFPNQFVKVERYNNVTVEALDVDGKKIKIEATDILAQCIQHECDHLEGHVFKEKMIPGTLEIITPEDIKK